MNQKCWDDVETVEALCERLHWYQAAQAQAQAHEQPQFVFFWGHQKKPSEDLTVACFSQWYEAPFEVNAQRYPTAEHFMMAQKATLFGDTQTEQAILTAPSPKVAKALGRQIKGFDEALWQQHRVGFVVQGNLAKFQQNRDLGAVLLKTASAILVEASPVDGIWGIGLAQDDPRAKNPNQWLGLNLLGFALMQVRKILRTT